MTATTYQPVYQTEREGAEISVGAIMFGSSRFGDSLRQIVVAESLCHELGAGIGFAESGAIWYLRARV